MITPRAYRSAMTIKGCAHGRDYRTTLDGGQSVCACGQRFAADGTRVETSAKAVEYLGQTSDGLARFSKVVVG